MRAIAKRDVGRDVAGKKKHVLQDQTQVAAQFLFVPLADVDAVDEDRAALDLVKAAERRNDRRLAAAGGADQSDFFAGAHAKGNVFEDRLIGTVGKPDVFEFDLAGETFGGFRTSRIFKGLRRIEQRKDSFRRKPWPPA